MRVVDNMSAKEAAAGPEGQLLEILEQHVHHEPRGYLEWKLTPEFPSGGEVLASMEETKDLPHNRVGEVWESKEAYLEAQYSILRRQGTEGLRHAVNLVRSNPESQDDEEVCVYKRVRVLGYLMARIGPICRISFSTENAGRRIQWLQSPRLTPGTIIAISTAADQFRTICKIASVAQRPYKDGLDQNPPQVDIIWAKASDAVVDPELELVMVESRTGYFEAVRHALVGLQMAATCHSLLDKYLINGDRSDPPAQFIVDNPVMDMSSLVHTRNASIDWNLLREHDVLKGIPDVRGVTSMDNSQVHALHRIVTKELAIIQGPPGTGKTFTSVAALKVILASRKRGDPPVVVAAQTNHALDQLLSLILDHGARIVRVGGRTENERIAEHTVFMMRQRSKVQSSGFRAIEGARQGNIHRLKGLVLAAFNDGLLDPNALLTAGILTQSQYTSLVNDDMEQSEIHRSGGPFSIWLGAECVPAKVLRRTECNWVQGDDNDLEGRDHEFDGDLEHIAVDEEDRERIRGTFIGLAHKWAGKEPSHLSSWQFRAEKELRKEDLFEIPKAMRGAVYQLLMAKFIAKLQPMFASHLQENINICKDSKINRWETDIEIVAEECIDVVGCTTTGLTKYRGFLAALQPRTLMIEEAAETRESNISSALYPSLQQLILVGDHQQLAPSCDVRWLGESPFYLNVSLFQRMIELGVPYIMLNQQRRMIPSIRRILTPFYPELTDHPLVTDITKRPPVPGMGGHDTWLFTHDWEEDMDSNLSRFNEQEAQMVVRFFSYLVSNGVKPAQISILTFYNGQRKTILGKLKKHGSITADSFNVFTVDSYQGEENDIVLLSLVRSPRENRPWSIGFLENQNRAVVAISRARRGFYLFGNMDNVLSADQDARELWGRIWNGFAEIGRVRRKKGLPLTCQKHGNTIWIKEVEDWGDNAGGCDEVCQDIRPCGHRCTLKCHIIPHENLGCSHPCRKVMDCGHRCASMCSLECRCDCDDFRSLMEKKQARANKAEDHLHMSFEELLTLEAAPGTPSGYGEQSTSMQVALHPENLPSPPARASPAQAREISNGAAKFRDFVKNIKQHDEKCYLDRCAALGVAPHDTNATGEEQCPFPSSSSGHAEPIGRPSQPIIRDTYKPTTLINGVRARAGPKVVVCHGGPRAPSGTKSLSPAAEKEMEKEDGPPGEDEDWLIEL